MPLSTKTYDVSSKEILEIISKQWCSNADFMRLAGCSKTTCYKYVTNLKRQLDKKKIFYPVGLLPMEDVIKYLHLDVKKLENDVRRINELKLN